VTSGSPDAAGTLRSRFRSERAESWTREWISGVASGASPPLSSRFVETRLGTTHVLQSPEQPSASQIVCFPGWGLPGAFWAVAPGLEALAAAGRVHIVDLPGQPGLSSGETLRYSAEGMQGWGRDLLDGLGLRRAHLMGVSVGALVALGLASRLPETVDRLALCAPAGFVLPLLGPRRLYAMTTYLMHPSRDRCSRFYRRCVLGPRQSLEPGVGPEVDEAFFRLVTGFSNRSVPPVWMPDRELGEVGQDTLVLLGETDPVFSPIGTARRARKLLRGLSAVRILEGHGHALELSPVVKRVAGQFLSGAAASNASAR